MGEQMHGFTIQRNIMYASVERATGMQVSGRKRIGIILKSRDIKSKIRLWCSNLTIRS